MHLSQVNKKELLLEIDCIAPQGPSNKENTAPDLGSRVKLENAKLSLKLSMPNQSNFFGFQFNSVWRFG